MRLRPLVLCVALASCGDGGTTTETSTTMATEPAATEPALTTSDVSTGEDMTSTGADTSGTTMAATTEEPTGVVMASFEVDIQPILTAICVTACHEPGGSGFGETTLDMTAGVAYALLVDVPAVEPSGLDRIEPGSPDTSYLWHKINGTQMTVGGVGNKMPIGKMLTPEEIDLIEAWILGGALP